MVLPHTAYVEAPLKVQETSSRKVTNLHYAATVEVRCQITPADQRTLDQFGIIELRLPHLLMAEVASADSLVLGSKVSCNGRSFTIATPVQRWDALPGANSCGVLLQETTDSTTSGFGVGSGGDLIEDAEPV